MFNLYAVDFHRSWTYQDYDVSQTVTRLQCLELPKHNHKTLITLQLPGMETEEKYMKVNVLQMC